jgi:hypothetical protein
MSAFIVSTDTMDLAVAAICHAGQYGQIAPHMDVAGIRIYTSEKGAGTAIGRALWAMNLDACQQRYPSHADRLKAGVPGNYIPPCRKLKPAELVAGFKALECLSYQCSEGNVPDSPLYGELTRVMGEVAVAIVRALPAYERAPWG